MSKKKSKRSYYVEIYLSGSLHHIEIKNKSDAQLIANCLGGNLTVDMAIVRKQKQRGNFTITRQITAATSIQPQF